MTTTVPPLLTAAQRDQFTRFPLLDEPTLSRNYLLSTDDLVLIRQRRLEFNKLGYAVQLTVLRHLGRSIRPHEQPPSEVLQYLADQLHVDPDCYELYASRDTTRREHFAALCLHLGYVALSRTLNHELRDWLLPTAVLTDQPFPLMAILIDELRRRKILTPRLKVLERLTGVARIRADQHVYTLLNLPLKMDLAERVDTLLEPQDGESVSRLAWLSRPVGAPKARHLLTLLDKLAFVRTFPVKDHPAAHLPQSRLEQLAQEGRRISASHLAAFEPQRRRATVMARLLDLSRTLTDEVLDMHDRLMVSLIRAGEQAASLAYQTQGPSVVEQLGQYQQVLGAIVPGATYVEGSRRQWSSRLRY